MKKLILLAPLLAAFSLPAAASPPREGEDMAQDFFRSLEPENTLGGSKYLSSESQRAKIWSYSVEYFKWDEFNNAHGNNDGHWVSEFGPRFNLAYSHTNRSFVDVGFFDTSRHDVTLGVVAYHGGAKKYGVDNLKSKSLYVGYNYEKLIGYKYVTSSGLGFDAAIGGGINTWSRGIMNKTVTDQNGEKQKVGGHELFIEPYVSSELAFSYHMRFNKEIRLALHADYPIKTFEKSNDSSAWIQPKPNLNTGVSIGYYNNDSLNLSYYRLYYKQKKYGASDVNSDSYYQPESHQESFGIEYGYRFF